MMKIVSVAPIARGMGRETLTYFTARDVKEGMLVSVPVRSKKISALVLTVEEVARGKTDIKAADFKLKKIAESKGYILSPSFIRAAKETARYFAAHTGAAIETLVPNAVLEEAPTLRIIKNDSSESSSAFSQLNYEKLLLQTDDA